MELPDKPDDPDDTHFTKSRTSSRRNSASSTLSRKNSAKKDNLKKFVQKSPNTTPSSTQSTPKKTAVKPGKLDFMVTGKQLLKRCDRANSLPGVFHRRPSAECLGKKKMEASRRHANVSGSSKSRDTSLEDDMSLDLSQVSDFEDTNSKYGLRKRFSAIATSTPKPASKPRSGSLQGPRFSHRVAENENQSVYSSVQSCRDSYKTSSAASNYRHGGRSTDLDNSSVSPEYSAPSSTDPSPRTSQHQSVLSDVAVASPYSQRSQLSGSSCYMSWVDSEDKTKAEGHRPPASDGEWNCFWANYNSSVSRPIHAYYDQCPTPYRTENIDTADLAGGPRKRSPRATPPHLNRVIRTEGLQLTPRETQNLIKCAHILGSVLAKAIDRSSLKIEQANPQPVEIAPDAQVELKKKAFTLDLRDQSKPLQAAVVKTSEAATTQTDISLPNTKSAPKIFEKILRQLSKTSLDDAGERKEGGGDGESRKEDKT